MRHLKIAMILLFMGLINKGEGVYIPYQMPTIPVMSINDLELIIKDMDHDALIINVLQKHIYSDCAIAGSINIPIENLAKKLRRVDKGKKIILYSASQDCPVSKYAFMVLQKHGFTNVFVYQGGMREWYQKGLTCKGKCRAGYLKG